MGRLAVALAVVAVLLGGAGNAFATPAAGLAVGGSPGSPASQVQADVDQIATQPDAECGDDSLLVYRLRDAGETPGSDRLAAWSSAVAQAAIAKGWHVREIQSAYAVPATPFTKALAPIYRVATPRFRRGEQLARPTIARYHAAAKQAVPAVTRDLVAAYDRCKARQIIIGGYSLGASVLRSVVRKLPHDVTDQIADVDLIADTTGDNAADHTFAHPKLTGLPGQVFLGIDAAVSIGLGAFMQEPFYPTDMQRRVAEYCNPKDLACDEFGRSKAAHTAYPWARIGARAVTLLPDVQQLDPRVDDLAGTRIRIEYTNPHPFDANVITSQCGSFAGNIQSDAPAIGVVTPPHGAWSIAATGQETFLFFDPTKPAALYLFDVLIPTTSPAGVSAGLEVRVASDYLIGDCRSPIANVPVGGTGTLPYASWSLTGGETTGLYCASAVTVSHLGATEWAIETTLLSTAKGCLGASS